MIQISPAESILSQYTGSTPEENFAGFTNFCANILGFSPYLHQLFYALECFKNPYVLCVAPPRSGKTNGIEAVDLYETACYPTEDLVIYAPKYDQAKDSLSYHYSWIEQSPVLKALLKKKNGKPMLSSEGYTFKNGSNARIYSINGEIEGHNVSIMRPEEFDDWQWEKFANDVMRRGGAKSKNGKDKRIRLTGTIRGLENIYKMETDEEFKVMFKNLSWMNQSRLDIYYMLAAGVMDKNFVKFQKIAMTDDEWARSMLLGYTEATNFIKSVFLRKSVKASAALNISGEVPVKGERYSNRGSRIAVGFDCGHAGQKATSSKYALSVKEEISTGEKKYYRTIYLKDFDPKTDPDKIKNEVADIIDYFRPEGGYGDALNYTLIQKINQACYSLGATSINPDDFPDQTPGDWDQLFLSPMHNNGKNKDIMYKALELDIRSGYEFYPYYDPKDDTQIALDMKKLLNQLENIRQEITRSSYPSYSMKDTKIGDDFADADAMAKKWFLDHPVGYINLGLFKSTGTKRTYTSKRMAS